MTQLGILEWKGLLQVLQAARTELNFRLRGSSTWKIALMTLLCISTFAEQFIVNTFVWAL